MDNNLFNYNPEENLLRRFEEINDYIYANEGLSAQQTLNEFLKILFIKVLDEKKNLQKFRITSEEFRVLIKGEIIGAPLRRVNELFEFAKQEYKGFFDKDERIRLSNSSMGFILNKLQSISLKKSSNDAKGLAFQKFLTHGEKISKGQFFTPQPVIDFCVKLIDPKINETILDPCCGSGGFLHSAFQYIVSTETSKLREKIISENLYGLDINQEITRITKMKLLLEENISNNIYCINSLGDLDTIKLVLSKSNNFDGFDVIMTNPPFGSSGKITDAKILKSYQLGYKWKEDKRGGYYKTDGMVSGQPTEILFIERCLDLLKDGGRMAIVLPNGHFENPSLNYLRYYIRQKADIFSVINLPQETFIPYGTGVKTSILFLKKKSLKSSVHSIFFSKITKLGYQGNKNATPIYKKDGKGFIMTDNFNPLIDEDYSKVISEYKEFITNGTIETENSYSVSSKDVRGRIDYDYYSPANRNILKKLECNSVKLGDIITIVKERSPKLKNRETVVNYIELSDINTHSYEIINTSPYVVHELPSRATYELKEGDIITGIAGNSVGTRKHATALVTKEYEGAICTNGFRVLRDSQINPYYLLFFFHSSFFLKQMMMYRTGAAIPNVSDDDLYNIRIYLPSQSKINEIGDIIKKTFDLRMESKKLIESIVL